jgi:predicted NBD/HSP70 family sugar kinase
VIRSTSRSDVNRSAILARLGAQGPASRAELARSLGVSPALVTQLTRELLADGLLVELEQAPSQGGRPARLLGLAASAGRAVGVKIAPDHLAFVEVGIDGSVVRSSSEPWDASSPLAIAGLAELLSRFVGDRGEVPPLLGVGVGLPGSVDEQGGGVVDSTQLGWNQVPLGDALRRALALPVLLENNVNALSHAELLFGQARRHRDALVVTIGTGVGAGIILDGVVVRGAAGGAGELGHLPVQQDGPLCQCGNRGCLEAVIGEAALVATARERGIIARSAGMPALRAAADAGDAEAQRLFGDAGHLLGRAIAGAVNLLDPEAVILLGEGVAAWSHWAFGFEPAFRTALVPAKRAVPAVVETWQDEAWAQGAAALVLATPFDADGIAGRQGELVRERLQRTASARIGR